MIPYMNVRREKNWDDTNNVYVGVTNYHDEWGNVHTSQDANGHFTTFQYERIWLPTRNRKPTSSNHNEDR